MIDGIDGSGKDTVANSWKDFLSKEGNALFDLREYWKKNGTYPDFNELKSYDFIFTAEPTYVGVGKVIREELTRNGTNYPDIAIAHAFSLDRLVHYHKIIIPALKEGKCIIQVRGVSTSLCYQAVSSDLSLELIASLPGNSLALEHRPDHLVLMDVTPEITLRRLGMRAEKDDNAIFEKKDFLDKANKMFSNPTYQSLFTSRGSMIHYLPAEGEIDTMNAKAHALLTSLITP